MDIKNKTEGDRAKLYTIYQESFYKGYILEDWTDSFLRPIPKPENGYRNLIMQDTIRKLLECIVARKLARNLQDREIFPANRGKVGRGGSDQESAHGKM